MTLFRLALRSHLVGFIGTTAVAVVAGLANAVGYGELAGTDPIARAIFAQQMEILGRQLSYMLPLPAELDTLAGYLQWRHFGFLPVVYAFWAILASTAAARGDEERGLVEHWLAAGVRRVRYVLTRVLVFTVTAVASVAIMAVATYLGSVAADEPLPLQGLALQSLNVTALALCCFGIGLAVSQLVTTRRAAAGIAGVIVAAMYLVNSVARNGGLEPLRPFSPFWAYDQNRPLLGAGHVEWAAIGGLLGAAVVLAGLAAVAFQARDLGGPLLRIRPAAGRRVTRPSGDPLLRVPVLALVDQQRVWIAGWALGLAALAAFLISLTRLAVDALLAIPALRVYFERLGSVGYETFVGVIWGSTALLLLSVYAIAQVSSWVADDVEGRLEAFLAHPVSRARIVVERMGSLLIGLVLIVLVGSATVAFMSAREGIELDPGRFLWASALMPTVPLAFGAIGAVLAGSRPRFAEPVISAIAIVSYFTQQLAPLFDWPEWVKNTSLFALYGTPMSTGVEWGGIGTLIAIGVAGTVLAAAALRRRDVGR